jgi:hypothetical protein
LKTTSTALMTFILLTACSSSQAAPQNLDPSPAPIFTAIPTLTPPQPTPTYTVPPLDDATNVVYYFAPDVCNAKWTNNGQELPCPGVEGQISSGYVGLLTQVELNFPYKANALLTIPSQDGNFYGIFGTFPARKIEFADFFRAQLYCLPETLCDVAFSLGYYDSSGKFYEPFPFWPYYNHVDLPILINLPLDILAGQTVQLTLIVRDNGDPAGDYAVWVEPRIFRHPDISTPTP